MNMPNILFRGFPDSAPSVDFIDDHETRDPAKLPVVFTEYQGREKPLLLAPLYLYVLSESTIFSTNSHIITDHYWLNNKYIKSVQSESNGTALNDSTTQGKSLETHKEDCHPKSVHSHHKDSSNFNNKFPKFVQKFISSSNQDKAKNSSNCNMDFLDDVPIEENSSELSKYRHSIHYISKSEPGRKRRMIHCGYTPCTKKFRKSWNFIEHARTHLGIKPYQCRSCSRSFTQKANLAKHMRRQRH
ncbi:unnamed protein product [Moneuplotes crassus]|uniref:C2H2-type domain-containing protein n=1 Tax=Euplotes crassus TaxID=5936 RepID=A0AAD2CW99_EUPCR|nr:unnamed protein product [Moneuplotes crassus]